MYGSCYVCMSVTKEMYEIRTAKCIRERMYI